MRYKLYKETHNDYSALQQVLYNRGIPVENQEHWLNAGWNDISDWRLLDKDKMIKACNQVNSCLNNNKKIVVLTDPDMDGMTSAAIFINYLFYIDEEFVESNISYVLHKGKEHGLADTIDEIIQDKPDLVICPDSASNDIEQHKKIVDNGAAVICLDHHECDKDSLYALIINPQINDYPNKNITGAGVTWQFCKAYDELYGYNFADNLIDLCAIGNCGDMSDLRSLETRAFMNIGLSNIKNHFIKAMIQKNEYSFSKMNGVNYYSCAFYLVPFLNSICRSGTMEEKEIVFEALLDNHSKDMVQSSKRGEFKSIPLYQEAVTVAERVKRRQTKLQDEAMQLLEQRIEEQHLTDNAIILCLCEPGEIEKNLQGLVANKIQTKYQKPSAVLTYSKTKDDKEVFYRGSMRNYSLSPIKDLKAELEKTEEIELCAGHNSAAGLSIPANNINDFLKKFNEQYKNIDQTPVYYVDYIWNDNTLDSAKILQIGRFNIYGQNIQESLIVVENICLNSNMVTLMSPDKNPTLKIQLSNGVSAIKFKSSKEEYEEFCGKNKVLTFVAKCNVNEWNGAVSPQLLIEDFELQDKWIF